MQKNESLEKEIERLRFFFLHLLRIRNALIDGRSKLAAYELGTLTILTEKSIEFLEEQNGSPKRETEEDQKSDERIREGRTSQRVEDWTAGKK